MQQENVSSDIDPGNTQISLGFCAVRSVFVVHIKKLYITGYPKISLAKILIRLRKCAVWICAVWSESSLGIHDRRYVLWHCGIHWCISKALGFAAWAGYLLFSYDPKTHAHVLGIHYSLARYFICVAAMYDFQDSIGQSVARLTVDPGIAR